MSFKKNKYVILRNAISKELADFCYKYFLLKKNVAKILFESKYIPPFCEEWGHWHDSLVPDTYSHYGDIVMENLLQTLKPTMEKETGLKLNETYAFARLYKKGNDLKRHKDRFSCEISTTMSLGGKCWPIFLSPNSKDGIIKDNKEYIPSDVKGVKVLLNPGDMLIYRGVELEHWREKLLHDDCAQVFLHYNDVNSKYSNENKYDGRPSLGLPAYFIKKRF